MSAFLLFDEKTADCIFTGNLPVGMHLTVSDTVGGEGLLPVFTADKMVINTDSGFVEIPNPAIAVSKTESFGNGVSVLVNSDALQLIKENSGGELNAEKAVTENKEVVLKKEKRSLLHKRSADSACTVDTGKGKRNNAKNRAG